MMPRCPSPPGSAASPAEPSGASRPTSPSSGGRPNRPAAPPAAAAAAVRAWASSGSTARATTATSSSWTCSVDSWAMSPMSASCSIRATRPYFSRPVRDVVRDHDAIVIGGGDLLVPWGLGDRYWLTDYLRRPVHVIGVGVPTWRPAKPQVVAALGDFLRHRNVRSITARDEESAAWIREHLRPRVEVASSADLVFALPLPAVERPAEPPDPRDRRPLAGRRRRLHGGPGAGRKGARPWLSTAHDRALDGRRPRPRRAGARRARPRRRRAGRVGRSRGAHAGHRGVHDARQPQVPRHGRGGELRHPVDLDEHDRQEPQPPVAARPSGPAVRVRRSEPPRAPDPAAGPSTSRCATRWPAQATASLAELRERLLAG